MRSISTINIRNQFKQWLVDTFIEFEFGLYQPRPRIECNDGFSMSVQGGEYSYSNPRQFGSQFTEMEIGFPSEYEELIRGYAEGSDYTDTVYPYTPVKLIIQVIEKHGGMKKK